MSFYDLAKAKNLTTKNYLLLPMKRGYGKRYTANKQKNFAKKLTAILEKYERKLKNHTIIKWKGEYYLIPFTITKGINKHGTL